MHKISGRPERGKGSGSELNLDKTYADHNCILPAEHNLADKGMKKTETHEQFEPSGAQGREPGFIHWLLESVADGVIACDADGRLILFNHTARQWFGGDSAGISLDEWANHHEFYREDASTPLPAAQAPLVRAFQGETFTSEEMAIVAPGKPARFFRVSGGPIRDAAGRKLGAVVVMCDVTKLHGGTWRTPELEESKYMDLYENAPDMYASVNANTSLIQECNMTLANTLGYTKAEMIGRPVFEIYHPDCLKEAKNAFKLFVETGEIQDKELQLRRKDGSKLDVSLNASAVRGEDGQILFSRSTLRDITEHKRNNAINASRLHLLKFATIHSLDELLEETLNEAEKLTDSLIGFYHFVADDQKSLRFQNWSTKTKGRFCKTAGKGLHYPIAQAGVWVDCVHQGKAVIHNDYASLSHRKGMPQGHAEVIRELVVPIFRGNAIKAILGVGNKSTDYTEKDVEAASLLADFAWEIVERKQAEENVLRSEQRLRLHSEQSPLGFLEWDDNFRAIEWNAACERIFGYTREEAIGRHAKDLILPIEVHQLVDEIYYSLMNQTGGQHSINENITKDGRIIICEWFSTTLIDKDGKAIGVASVCRDITEQKKAEDELSRYREHLEELVFERTAELEIARNKAQQYLDIAGVILVVIDKNRKVTLINQKGCEVLGSTHGQIIGKDWFETFVPENVRQDVIQGFRKLMAGETEQVEYFENPVLTQDGQERLIAWHNALLRDDGGNIVGTLSSGEDITEHKRAEKQITRLNQNLLIRTESLEAANKELEAFAYSVSHDLRAPLRHIDGFIELLQQHAGPTLDEQSRHYMTTISDSVKKMGRLIDDLLSFSRMGRHAMSCRQVALEPLVRDVIRELEPDTAGRSISWRIGDLPVVCGDAAMLRMVMANLISNALKFTQPRQQAQIEIGSLPGQDSETVIFVRDNGVGFDMTYGARLFGVFQRLHREDEFEGTGIGLASVRRIIARHGGRTWAQGEPGQGAAFFFSLPQIPIGGKYAPHQAHPAR